MTLRLLRNEDLAEPGNASTFLRFVNLNRRKNLEDVVQRFANKGEPLPPAGAEVHNRPVAGIYIETPNLDSFITDLQRKSYVANRITLVRPTWGEELLEQDPHWTTRPDGAVILERTSPPNAPRATSYVIFKAVMDAVLAGFYTESIKRHEPDCARANQLITEHVTANYPWTKTSTPIDLRDYNPCDRNYFDSFGPHGIDTLRHVYHHIVSSATDERIEVFDDILPYISPDNMSYMGPDHRDTRIMGARTRMFLALAKRFPQITIIAAKETVHGPQKEATTGTSKVMGARYNSASQQLTVCESYHVLARDMTYLTRNLPAGLAARFNPKRHVVAEFRDHRREKTCVAAVVALYQGDPIQKGPLPLVSAAFMEGHPTSKRIEYSADFRNHPAVATSGWI
ncbi:hypothetical protein HY641_00840 [Candidatus Woesearchaeota archaeon]|nr:hypothetical protein [Candidatus Woesearchaeota archaeon]